MATPPKDPTDDTTPAAPPPAPRKPATPRKTTSRKTAASGAPNAPATRKPATAKPAAARTSPAAKPAATGTKKSAGKRATASKASSGRKWGMAAAIGAAGAAVTAGVLALRGSTPKAEPFRVRPTGGTAAHQADGTDSSASFQAGIADEGTVPE